MTKFFKRFKYNAPVVLTYTIISFLVWIIGGDVGSNITKPPLFSVGGLHFSFYNPLCYFQLISHIAGHANWEHLMGNFMLILLIGPLLEEKYGSIELLCMILATAVLTGVIQILTSDGFLLGASGIVFMMIILSSLSNFKEGEIPITFILVSFLYLGNEIMKIGGDDNVSQMAHIVGGVSGGFLGLLQGHSSKKKDG